MLDRRKVLQSLLAAAGLAAAAPALLKPPPDAPEPEDLEDEDEDEVLERERRAEAMRCAVDYRLILAPLFEAELCLEQVLARHEDCRGCNDCLDAHAFQFALEGLTPQFDCDAPVDAVKGALEDKRRAGWNHFEGEDRPGVQAALFGLCEVLEEVLARHEDCNCRLCRRCVGAHYWAQVYADLWGSDTVRDDRVEVEVARRQAARARLAASLGL